MRRIAETNVELIGKRGDFVEVTYLPPDERNWLLRLLRPKEPQVVTSHMLETDLVVNKVTLYRTDNAVDRSQFKVRSGALVVVLGESDS